MYAAILYVTESVARHRIFSLPHKFNASVTYCVMMLGLGHCIVVLFSRQRSE